MGKSKKKQREKAFAIFAGNDAAQEALKQAFQLKSNSGAKITNKEIGNLARAGATREQLNKLVERVEKSSGRLKIGSVDIGSYFPKEEGSGQTGGGQTITSTIDDYQSPFDTGTQQPMFDTSGMESQISGLNSQIGSLTTGFQNQLGALTAQMQQEREEATKRMEEMQSGFARALAERGNRPRVEGIRFATRGTGGATQQQLQRRGVRGTFGRTGERLMKISSLNV